MAPKANSKNSAVKRIMQEAKELADDDSPDYSAAPLDDNLFEWHATIRGASETEFEGGLYHLRILLPATYPFSAPDIMLVTPNGRFETNKKICIDGLTSFHAGSWQPAWGVRTAIVGLMAFWNSKGEAMQSVGALDYPQDERKRLARVSKDWKCDTCDATCLEMLPPPSSFSQPVSANSSSTAHLHSIPTLPTRLDAPTVDPAAAEATGPSPVDPVPSKVTSFAVLDPTAPPPLPPDAVDTATPIPDVPSPHHPLSSLAPMPPSPSLSLTSLVASPRPLAPVAPASPLWLDAILGLVIALVVVLIARRMI